ncbi:hypothetical protein Afe05nite_81010 [Paractinoplanes ferrugineus]|uniref:Uncharacterized protein n=1 Tax=Paractinoplanes ferrugineus TaxID=113564 RepID=A0A919MDX2_9ACTN|nr:hypothetical protein Afe05nite_81010 [Actinoplanes ferrugineus]
MLAAPARPAQTTAELRQQIARRIRLAPGGRTSADGTAGQPGTAGLGVDRAPPFRGCCQATLQERLPGAVELLPFTRKPKVVEAVPPRVPL